MAPAINMIENRTGLHSLYVGLDRDAEGAMLSDENDAELSWNGAPKIFVSTATIGFLIMRRCIFDLSVFDVYIAGSRRDGPS